MRQVVLTGRGGPEALVLREAPEPRPAAGEVRVRVRLAGVNFADVMARLGLHPDSPRPPTVPGHEACGVIDAVGAGVPEGRRGERVAVLCPGGAYAQLLCVAEDLAFALPGGVDDAAAAALPLNYLTAHLMLRVMAPVNPDDRVLVHGAAGGVGQAAGQLTRLAGGRVLATASPAKHDVLRRQGADLVLDSRSSRFAAAVREATGGRGADVALEPRHGRWILESYRALAPGGRLVLHGFASAAERGGVWGALTTLARVPWLRLNPIALLNDNKSVGGVNLARMWGERARLRAWMGLLIDELAAGRIAPTIDRVLPLAAAGAAQLRLQRRENVGKVLLDCGTEGAR